MLTQLTFDSGLTTDPTLSSDGQFLAYVPHRAGADDLEHLESQLIDGTAAIASPTTKRMTSRAVVFPLMARGSSFVRTAMVAAFT